MTETRRDTTFDADPDALGEARALLAEHPAVDLHCDTVDRALKGVDVFEPWPRGAQAGPPCLEEGGVGTAIYVLWIPPHLGPDRALAHLHRMKRALDETRRRLADDGSSLSLLTALEDARVLLGDGSEAATSTRVSEIAAWGVRYVTPTWNTGNRWASSCEDTRGEVGLTRRGHELVAALDGAGIRVDLSHLSDRAAFDVLDAAALAPIASHSSARAICPHARNVSDELARRIAMRGGVVGVNVHRSFLAIAPSDATLARVVRHVEHLWSVAGEEAVALGTDFDGIPRGPAGLEHAGRLPHLVGTLLSRGHDRQRIVRLVSANARRVLEAPVAQPSEDAR
jgi:membrane dipeptidase